MVAYARYFSDKCNTAHCTKNCSPNNEEGDISSKPGAGHPPKAIICEGVHRINGTEKCYILGQYEYNGFGRTMESSDEYVTVCWFCIIDGLLALILKYNEYIIATYIQ